MVLVVEEVRTHIADLVPVQDLQEEEKSIHIIEFGSHCSSESCNLESHLTK